MTRIIIKKMLESIDKMDKTKPKTPMDLRFSLICITPKTKP